MNPVEESNRPTKTPPPIHHKKHNPQPSNHPLRLIVAVAAISVEVIIYITMKRGSKKSDSDATNAKTSKRPREEEQTAPQYGSKEYWESRYKSHLTDAKLDANTSNADKSNNTNEATDIGEAGHAWYFSYEELRPLILPLILGSEESEAEEVGSDFDDSDSWVEEDLEEEDEIENDDEEEVDGDRSEEEDEAAKEHPDADECADDAEEHDMNDVLIAKRTSLPDKPKKVLEIGCGDVALGAELAKDLVNMQGAEAELFVDEICCIDYSDTVVKTLIDKQKEEHNGSSSTLQASFRSLDARCLPHAPNTFDLVLEKGTLDAMLSDKDDGVKNCIQIVKEMARVTNIGGSILIVSHLNANESKGMTWLEDVVFSGLEAEFKDRREAMKKEARYYVWSIQIHGGEGQLMNDEDGEEVMTYGPAVYIIRKKSVPAARAKELFGKSTKKDIDNDTESSENGDKTELTLPPVKVEFLTYD